MTRPGRPRWRVRRSRALAPATSAGRGEGGGPRRVVLVSHYFPPHPGGIEFVAYNEARLLAAAGLSVVVVTCEPDGATTLELHPDGFSVYRIRAWNGLERRHGAPFPLMHPSVVPRLLRLVRTADVVHVHDSLYLISWVAAAWCALLRRPLVVTQHVHHVAHPNRVVELAQRVVYRTAGLVLCCARRATSPS